MSWQEVRRAAAYRVRASGHASLCRDAVRIMPRLSHDDAKAVRVAMLAGPGQGLRDLVLKHWVAA